MELNNNNVMENEKITALLNEKFGDAVLSSEAPYDLLTLVIRPAVIMDVIRFLYDHPETEFKYLTTLCGIHLPDTEQIAVMYQLHSLVHNRRLRLKIFLPADNPVAPSLTSIFAAANWMERETYDFYGVQFQGHPDLRRILNVEDMIIFPLRKEYPLEDQTRQDKTDYMFGR